MSKSILLSATVPAALNETRDFVLAAALAVTMAGMDQ
jgi:hypothetical protein